MKHIISLIVCILITTQQFAQAVKKVNADKQVKENISKIDSIKAFAKQAYNLLNKDSVKIFGYINRIDSLSRTINYQEGIAEALLIKGKYYISKAKGLKALNCFNVAHKIIINLKDESKIAYNKINLANGNIIEGDRNEAIKYVQEAENVFKKQNDTAGLIIAYSAIAVAYQDKAMYGLAIDYNIKSAELQEAQKNQKGIGSIYNNIGRQLYEIKNFSESIKYFNLGIKKAKEENDLRLLGIIYVNKANAYIQQQEYEQGKKMLLSANENFEKIGFKRGSQTCYNNLGAISLRIQQYSDAINFLNKSLQIATENDNIVGVALIEHNIGYGYLGLKKYTESLNWYQKAEATAIKAKADNYTFSEIYRYRAKLDSAMGNFSSAYNYKAKYQELYESMMNEKSIKLVNEAEIKFETVKKENKILLLSKADSIKALQIKTQQAALTQQLYGLAQADLKIAGDSLLLYNQQQKILNNKLDSAVRAEKIITLTKEDLRKQLALNKKNSVIGIIILAAIVVIAGSYVFLKKKRLEYKLVLAAEQTRQRDALAKAVISAEEAERKRIAGDLHDGVGQIFSAVKMNLSALVDRVNITDEYDKLLAEKTMALVDESCKEVRIISHKMMPNMLLKSGIVADIRSFISKIDGKVLKIYFETKGFQEQLEFSEEIVLYRAIQELVNNVIKHSGANELHILLEKSNKQILVKIIDNGVGFNYEDAVVKNGLGLKNIKVRIEYLRGTINFTSNQPTGTIATIVIPFA